MHAHRCELTLDLAALARNYTALVARAPGDVGVVVKANAYGLGVQRIAPVLQSAGARHFFVASAEEAKELRAIVGEQAFTYVFDGPVPETVESLLQSQAIPVLNSSGQVQLWRQLGAGAPAALHVDTGMARLGVPWRELADLDLDGLNLTLLMSHLACADEPEHPLNAQQLKRFSAVRSRLPNLRTSLANSPGLFLGPEFAGDLARAGIVLYGGLANPADGSLECVATLRARVLSVRSVLPGDSVGYGASWTASEPGVLATVAIGYADGLPRALSNRGWLSWQGERCPIRGRVSMDLVSVDVTGLSSPPQEGDWMEVFGPNSSITELAAAADTIDYTLLTGLGRRHAIRIV